MRCAALVGRLVAWLHCQMYETPLYLAALEGQESAVSLLLDNGALVNATDTVLNTPLHAAAAGGHVGIAALLLERGGNPHQLNEVRLQAGGTYSGRGAPPLPYLCPTPMCPVCPV